MNEFNQEQIIKVLEKIKESIKETQVLYELTEAELIIFSTILADLPISAMSGKLLGRFLRAAAHFIERNEEIAKEFSTYMNKK